MPELPARPSLSQIRKQAKSLRKSSADADVEALGRLRTYHLDHADLPADQSIDISLREAQLVVAREYGYDSWSALWTKVETESGKETLKSIREGRIRQQTSSDREIERVILAATGSGVAEKTRYTEGFSCETYAITTQDGQRASYRANWYCRDAPHFATEVEALQELGNRDIPGPRNLYVEHNLPGCPNRSVVVNTWVEGVPLQKLIEKEELARQDMDRLIRAAGVLIGRIHQIPKGEYVRYSFPHIQTDPDWRAFHWNSIDHERLQQSAENTSLPWNLIEEGLSLLEKHLHLGEGVQPVRLHGEFDPGHIIVKDGEIQGLIDFEYAKSDDAAEEAGFGKDTINDSWWNAFTGEKRKLLSARPLFDGYREVADVDDRFIARSKWHVFRNQLGGLSYHGVNDVNTAGMMDFLNWRYRQDLEAAKISLAC